MSEKKFNLGMFLGGLVLVIVGILILAKQTAFVKLIVIFASVAAFVDGVYTIFAFRQWQFVGLTNKMTLIKGILMILSGIIGIIMPLVAANAVVTVVVYVFAAMLVYSAVVSIQDAFVLKKIDSTIARGHFYVEAAFSILVALIFFSDPSKILSAFVVAIGAIGIVTGVVFLVLGFVGKNNSF